MANSVGVIDKTYRGELMAPVRSIGPEYNIECGERYFQIVAPDMGWITEVRIVDSLPETPRGEGGFGSSGKWLDGYIGNVANVANDKKIFYN